MTHRILRRMRQRVKLAWWAFVRLIHRPRVPDGGVVRLHLGCGEKDIEGYINIDGRAMPHIHYVVDVTDLSFLPEDYADLIYCSHVLEHVAFADVPDVLAEWRRVLKPGGVLRISVPDFNEIVHIYDKTGGDLRRIQPMLMGGQDYALNFHKSVYDKVHLTGLLSDVGFASVHECDEKWLRQYDDWSTRKVSIEGKKYPVSLNMEAVK